MISKQTFEALLNWQYASGRIVFARFSGKVIFRILCYAPTGKEGKFKAAIALNFFYTNSLQDFKYHLCICNGFCVRKTHNSDRIKLFLHKFIAHRKIIL